MASSTSISCNLFCRTICFGRDAITASTRGEVRPRVADVSPSSKAMKRRRGRHVCPSIIIEDCCSFNSRFPQLTRPYGYDHQVLFSRWATGQRSGICSSRIEWAPLAFTLCLTFVKEPGPKSGARQSSDMSLFLLFVKPLQVASGWADNGKNKQVGQWMWKQEILDLSSATAAVDL